MSNCNKSNCNSLIFLIGVLLTIFMIVFFEIIMPFYLGHKINRNIYKYSGIFIASLLVIFLIFIVFIAIISNSCDIKKNAVSKSTFGYKDCLTSSDCNINQQCSWFKCKNKKIENETCECSDDCVNNLWCNKEKCKPKKRIGEICCSDNMCLSQKCSDENLCVNSVNSIGDINDSCRTNDDCMFNLWCDDNKCNIKQNDGNKCNNNESCISGKCSSELYCLSKDNENYYIPNNRGPCKDDSECLPGLVCDESVCKNNANVINKKKSCKN